MRCLRPDTRLSQDLPYHARFGGLDWSADVPLDRFDPAPESAPAAIRITRQDRLSMSMASRTVGRARISDNSVRFDWFDEVSFELVDGSRIDWQPGPDWRGRFPVSFFSSMAAITLAWRGILPLHASAVVLNDRAWLVAGNPAAGKSTLAAELVEAGAMLLADDLTALSPGPVPRAWRGRPEMRLHPKTAERIEQVGEPEPTDDERGKLLVRPVSRAVDRAWPVGGILLLSQTAADGLGPGETAIAVGSLLFRPKIVSALPGRALVRAGLLELARTVPMAIVPPVSGFSRQEREARATSVFGAIARLAKVKSAR